jgi:hypothetical protein
MPLPFLTTPLGGFFFAGAHLKHKEKHQKCILDDSAALLNMALKSLPNTATPSPTSYKTHHMATRDLHSPWIYTIIASTHLV